MASRLPGVIYERRLRFILFPCGYFNSGYLGYEAVWE